MANLIERLEARAKEATARPWRVSADGEILAERQPENEDERHTIEVYGGWPVAEPLDLTDEALDRILCAARSGAVDQAAVEALVREVRSLRAAIGQEAARGADAAAECYDLRQELARLREERQTAEVGDGR